MFYTHQRLCPLHLAQDFAYAQAKLYLNDNPQPVLIVNNLKLGAANSSAIGLFVDTGTDAFFPRY